MNKHKCINIVSLFSIIFPILTINTILYGVTKDLVMTFFLFSVMIVCTQILSSSVKEYIYYSELVNVDDLNNRKCIVNGCLISIIFSILIMNVILYNVTKDLVITLYLFSAMIVCTQILYSGAKEYMYYNKLVNVGDTNNLNNDL